MSKANAKPKIKPDQRSGDMRKEQDEANLLPKANFGELFDRQQRLLELTAMTNYELYLHTQKLENDLYELGRREAKEFVRGKYLHVISSNKRKYKMK